VAARNTAGQIDRVAQSDLASINLDHVQFHASRLQSLVVDTKNWLTWEHPDRIRI